MFEAEVEMERRSSFLPLLSMMCLVAAIAGLAVYVGLQVRANAPLKAEQASGIVTAALQGPGPAVVHFRTGLVKPNPEEKPEDLNYRLLEKAGIVRVTKQARGSALVSLTPAGERLLGSIPSYKKTEQADGTFLHQAPLAERQLIAVTGVETGGTGNAVVDYTWKWLPNGLGDVFDASGPSVQSFNTWDRGTLISKYEADFYHSSSVVSHLSVVRNGRGWKVAGF